MGFTALFLAQERGNRGLEKNSCPSIYMGRRGHSL